MQPIRVCLVEDGKEVREGMISLLTLDNRFEILAAYSDAESALLSLPAWEADIVIMDINLPGMSGIDCIRRVKKLCPHSQFIMFTIYEDDEKVFEALEAGANGYLLKKTPMSKITDSLIELHEGGAPMSTQIARKVIERMHTGESIDSRNILSVRENEILQLLSKGLLYKEISDRLNISTGTVRQHIHRIYEKLHVQNRTEAINKAFGNNLHT
ncbi:MAG TPA: response regulator transcription factor [Puia sp.]